MGFFVYFFKSCANVNFARRDSCNRCGTGKPGMSGGSSVGRGFGNFFGGVSGVKRF